MIFGNRSKISGRWIWVIERDHASFDSFGTWGFKQKKKLRTFITVPWIKTRNLAIKVLFGSDSIHKLGKVHFLSS